MLADLWGSLFPGCAVLHLCWFIDPQSSTGRSHLRYFQSRTKTKQNSTAVMVDLERFGSTRARTHKPAYSTFHTFYTCLGWQLPGASRIADQLTACRCNPFISVACTRQVRPEAISGRQARAEAESSKPIDPCAGLAGWLAGQLERCLPCLSGTLASANMRMSGGQDQRLTERKELIRVRSPPRCEAAEAARCHHLVASQFDPHDSSSELE